MDDGDQANEALFQSAFPLDRTAEFNIDFEAKDAREKIDETILAAFSYAPIFSDYALVSQKPTPAELATALIQSDEAAPLRIPIISDDCLIIVADDRIEQLVTISRHLTEGRVFYQVGVNVFRVDVWTAASLCILRKILGLYGLVCYPDSDLIDQYGVDAYGRPHRCDRRCGDARGACAQRCPSKWKFPPLYTPRL